jgi:hypothetical protein
VFLKDSSQPASSEMCSSACGQRFVSTFSEGLARCAVISSGFLAEVRGVLFDVDGGQR